MTVTYTAAVATSSGFGCFWKLLFRWRGSIYKLVWHELLMYMALYTFVSLVYRLALPEEYKRTFEAFAIHVEKFSNLIPVAFVLGFYVSLVMTRWWAQYMAIPFPSSIAVHVSTSIQGQSPQARLIRRTILRYVNLTSALTLAMISPTVKKRFPTLSHYTEMGFMTEHEQNIFEAMDTRNSLPKYWIPIVWAGALVSKARKEGRIRDDFAVKTIMDELNDFRESCNLLLMYDYISVPLVYTQVVTWAVYTYFLSSCLGRQFLDPKQNYSKRSVDFYVPVFPLLQFFFYMGWFKVAESLINPFGDNDDDFEVNAMVDKNLMVSYLIVDEMHLDHPELIKDMYYDEVVPSSLPYTVAADQLGARTMPHQGSTGAVVVPAHKMELIMPVSETGLQRPPSPGSRKISLNRLLGITTRRSSVPELPQSSVSPTAAVLDDRPTENGADGDGVFGKKNADLKTRRRDGREGRTPSLWGRGPSPQGRGPSPQGRGPSLWGRVCGRRISLRDEDEPDEDRIPLSVVKVLHRSFAR